MLDVKKLIFSAEACLGWPYASPGSNDARGIDCSGLFVKCFRDQGASIYHGSNTIYRKHCSEKGELTSIAQLRAGMAVFKWNPKTPEKFDDDLGDFQHIGLVTSINPLRIVHASSAAGCVTTDARLGKWAYWGWLKDVSKEGSSQIKTAIVTAPTGVTVNLRVRAAASSAVAERVPIGSSVEVLDSGSKWSRVNYDGKIGYMMTDFLASAQSSGDLTLEGRIALLEQRVSRLEGKAGIIA